jgi:hypothetical protein
MDARTSTDTERITIRKGELNIEDTNNKTIIAIAAIK